MLDDNTAIGAYFTESLYEEDYREEAAWQIPKRNPGTALTRECQIITVLLELNV